jgi:hypothetical protein
MDERNETAERIWLLTLSIVAAAVVMMVFYIAVQ